MNEQTDIIIVGAGAAGSVLATRLSENPKLNITVIEAGKDDLHPFIHIPAGFIKMIFNNDYIWPFETLPSDLTGNRKINVLSGKVVGGSGSINGFNYNRGQPSDFNDWAQSNKGWDYDSVLPYFVKAESFDGESNPQVRGKSGPLPISKLQWSHDICSSFLEGAIETGLPKTLDYNDGNQEGVGYFQRIIKGRRRVSSARAYLKPALKRPNLRLLKNAVVSRVLFDGKRAIGVEYLSHGNGEPRRLKANRQVILSCGTVNTPRLLQISGVGAVEDLERIGVEPVNILPGVGRNLRDHYSVRVVARVKNAVTINEMSKVPRVWGEAIKWMMGVPSIMTLSPSLVHIFTKSRPELETPDLQGVFSPASYKQGFVGLLDDYPGMTCGFWAHRPHSTGYVKARSTNPLDNIDIQPNYLSEQRDVDTLICGIKWARKLMQTGPMKQYFDHEQLPGKDVQRDDELEDFARRNGVSSWHLIGTSKMGPTYDLMAVVDEKLSVHGVEGLSIVDASVMPTSPSANTYAATIMIAEKASDMIGSALAKER